MKLDIEIDDRGLRRGFKDFKNQNPIAVRNTLNTVAALSRKNAVKNVRQDFTLRNNFTVGSIRFDQAYGRNISKMRSKMGALDRASYMRIQEFGGKRKQRGRATAIPQRAARRAGMASSVSRKFYVTKIAGRMLRGSHSRKIRSNKAKFVADMFAGYRKKKFIRRGNHIFRVKSIQSRGGTVRAQLDHLYTIEPSAIMVRKEPWMKPAIQKPTRDMGSIYRSQLRKRWKTGPEKL